VYIANVMTQPGETRGFTVSEHVRAIHQNTGRRLIQWVVMNNQSISPDVARRYRAKGAEPVVNDVAELQHMGLQCISDDLLEVHAVVRHDSKRLAHLLLARFLEKSVPRKPPLHRSVPKLRS